ncbi:MAG: DUF3786 domain-containing protein [Desulfobacterales bacterium]|nr:DUF3786 domain-containing protein [Desulfobacterales bacterium]
MTRINSPMEIFKLLNGSNCRACNEKTCMAFAVAVFKERRSLDECPYIDEETLAEYGGKTEKPNTIDEYMAEAVENLKLRIPGIDLSEAAGRTGADFDGRKLTVRVMGKAFCIDAEGNLSADIHINAWVAVPVLNYVLYSSGAPASGNWITFRELKGGPERLNHFQQNCEKPFKRIADSYPGLFRDMLEVFSGRHADTHINSDISIILYPLPLLPVLFCYWEPEEGMGSSLHIFFDKSADKNLDSESIYIMLEGMAKMFDKIAERNRSKQS